MLLILPTSGGKHLAVFVLFLSELGCLVAVLAGSSHEENVSGGRFSS